MNINIILQLKLIFYRMIFGCKLNNSRKVKQNVFNPLLLNASKLRFRLLHLQICLIPTL